MAIIINSAKKKPGDLIIFPNFRTAYDDTGTCYTVAPGDVGLVMAISSTYGHPANAVIEYTVLLGNIVLYYLEEGLDDYY